LTADEHIHNKDWLYSWIIENKKLSLALFVLAALIPTLVMTILKLVILRWKSIGTGLFVNYELEFVKRGLIGEAFRHIFSEITFSITVVFSFIIMAGAIIVLAVLFYKPYRLNNKPGLFLFFLFAITHFATANQFIFDIGRFDQALLVIAFVCFILINKRMKIGYLLIPCLLVLGLLIHEGFFFMFIPLIIAYYIYKNKICCWKLAFLLFLGILAVGSTYIIGTEGQLTKTSIEDHQRYINEKNSEISIPYEPEGIHTRGVKENIGYTVERLANRWTVFGLLVFFPAVLPTIMIFKKIFRAIIKSKKERLLMLACLTPLLLYPLGIDGPRWIGLAITNLFIVTSLLALNKSHSNKLNSIMVEIRHLVIGAIIISVILGPIGVVTFFTRITEPIRFLVGYRP
jgi:hypothetical protein